MKPVAINRVIYNALNSFIEKSGDTVSGCMEQSIYDYVNIMNYVIGDTPETELHKIMDKFEDDAKIVFKKMADMRTQYLKTLREESILLNKEINYVKDCINEYFITYIPVQAYELAKSFSKTNPYIYSMEKKTYIKDVINRAVLLRVMKNNNLINNDIYRAWRLKIILTKEDRAKLNLDQIMEFASKKRKVRWSDE